MLPIPAITGPQDPAGVNAFQNNLINQFNANAPGLLTFSTTPGSNLADAGPDVLQTFTLPPNILGVNGKGIRVTCWGVTANNVNVKTLGIKFGTAFLLTQTLTASSVGPWMCVYTLLRVTATTQIASMLTIDSAAITPAQSTAGAETLANALGLVVQGTSSASTAGDITSNGVVVEIIQ